ncbi:hypothetical protein VNO77_33221 [Canavalia gladiata]|uniref:Uncharacterized protein n=1 Tax=Canavalia gladiata TaxID=3824 RepID=A0AAN9KF68_CANGL
MEEYDNHRLFPIYFTEHYVSCFSCYLVDVFHLMFILFADVTDYCMSCFCPRYLTEKYKDQGTDLMGKTNRRKGGLKWKLITSTHQSTTSWWEDLGMANGIEFARMLQGTFQGKRSKDKSSDRMEGSKSKTARISSSCEDGERSKLVLVNMCCLMSSSVAFLRVLESVAGQQGRGDLAEHGESQYSRRARITFSEVIEFYKQPSFPDFKASPLFHQTISLLTASIDRSGIFLDI